TPRNAWGAASAGLGLASGEARGTGPAAAGTKHAFSPPWENAVSCGERILGSMGSGNAGRHSLPGSVAHPVRCPSRPRCSCFPSLLGAVHTHGHWRTTWVVRLTWGLPAQQRASDARFLSCATLGPGELPAGAVRER